MKVVYCSRCGQRLNIERKALPRFAKIIDIVEWHECTDEVQELDLTPVDIPMPLKPSENNKFVQNLNKLTPNREMVKEKMVEPGDKRPKDQVKSSAPTSLADLINSFDNTEPERSFIDLDKGD